MAEKGFRHREIELDGANVIEGGDDRAGRNQGSGTDPAKAEHAGKWRGDDAIGQGGPDGIGARPRGVAGGQLAVELAAGDGALLDQFGQAVVLLAGFDKSGLGRFQLRHFGTPGQVHQYGPGFNVITVVEVHPGHGLGDLGRERHRFVGLGRAQRLDFILPRQHLHLAERDQLRWCTKRLARTMVAVAACTQGNQGQKAQGGGQAEQGMEHGGSLKGCRVSTSKVRQVHTRYVRDGTTGDGCNAWVNGHAG